MKTRIAIVGYGNIGKSIEKIVANSGEFELVGVFSRRQPSKLSSPFESKFFSQNTLLDDRFCGKIDVVMLCVGSAFDLESTALKISNRFCTVDSFDTHARMGEYLQSLDTANKLFGTLSIVGCGWDPGLFSLMRTLFASVVPHSIPQTFWGKGVSQGHSEAIRKIAGVKNAIQYTVPNETAISRAMAGEVDFSTRDKHTRECFVVVDYAGYYKKYESLVSEEEKRALESQIAEQIVSMPNYFADYDTTVNFVDEAEFKRTHTKMNHAGRVIAASRADNKSLAQFCLTLESNPDFTAQVMLAYARACHKMYEEGKVGAITVLDVQIKYLYAGDALKFV